MHRRLRSAKAVLVARHSLTTPQGLAQLHWTCQGVDRGMQAQHVCERHSSKYWPACRHAHPASSPLRCGLD